jgi:hypothetical protein
VMRANFSEFGAMRPRTTGLALYAPVCSRMARFGTPWAIPVIGSENPQQSCIQPIKRRGVVKTCGSACHATC